jgi:hypothetical protein
MKKIFLIFALLTGMSSVVLSQNLEKALKTNKWYGSADMGSATIILSKAASATNPFDIKFNGDHKMNYCYVVKSALLDPKGVEVKAGTHYCDPLYTYSVKDNMLIIEYPLVKWYYDVKMLPNGDFELTGNPFPNK